MRDNRTVTLTEAGEELREFAKQTLLQYQQLRHTIDQQGPSLSGELHIFCSVTAAYSHLPGEELREFAKQTLLQYQQLRHTIDQQGPSLSGELHIFCSVTAAYSHLPPILDRFRAAIVEHLQNFFALFEATAQAHTDKDAGVFGIGKTVVELGDRCLQPSAADSRSLPRGTPVGGD